jgi:hypothetical protein
MPKKKEMFRIPARAFMLLEEALRRYIFYARMRDGKKWNLHDLMYAWTGLGSATTYKPATDFGVMEVATEPNPGYGTWWRLTEAGARILLYWKHCNSFEAKDFEITKSPPQEIPVRFDPRRTADA